MAAHLEHDQAYSGRPIMIPDLDIWRAALLMVKRYGDDAAVQAADADGGSTWQRIATAIERLQAKAPAEGEKVH